MQNVGIKKMTCEGSAAGVYQRLQTEDIFSHFGIFDPAL
jgi:hypothetical protein